MVLPLHAYAAQNCRNDRKRILFEKWVALGTCQIYFDATHSGVIIPDKFKNDPDFWLQLWNDPAQGSTFVVFPDRVEGLCNPPAERRLKPFDYTVPWDSIHALYSYALNERHTYVCDVDRAARRHELSHQAKTGRPIPC